jgi:hypothetical protein
LPETDFPLKADHGVLPTENPVHACLGRIAAVWASFEAAAADAICVHGFMTEEIGACVSAQLNALNPRLRLLIALLRLDKDVSAESIELITKLANAIGRLEKRNRALSHLPGNRSGELGQFRVTADRQPDHESLAASLAELEILHAEIVETLKRFRALCVRIADESYAAWKKKQP